MQPQPNQPNAFEKMLPTIGGVAGGVLGGLAGTPFDLISGPAGTIAGATGGGALGGAAGKWLEDALTGNKSTVQDVGGAALEQGAGNLVGGAVGEGASAVGRGVLDSLGGTTAGQFVKNKASQYAGALLHNQLQAGMGATKMNPVDLSSQLSQAGISDARQIPDIFNMISGANGAISKGVRGVAAAAGSGGDTGVDTSGLLDMTKGLLGTDMGIGVTPADEAKILQTVKQAVNATAPNGEIGEGLVPGTEALSAVQGLSKSAYAQFGKAYDKLGTIINPSAHAAGSVLSNIADELENRLFSNVPVTDAMKEGIINDLAPLKSVNPTFYNDIVSKVSQAQSGDELRAAQAPIVNANQVYNAATDAASNKAAMSAADLAKNVAPVLGAFSGNPALMVASILPKLATSQAADRLGSSVLGSLGRSGATESAADTAGAKVAPMLSHLGSVTGAATTGLANSGIAAPATSLNQPQQPNGAMSMNGNSPQQAPLSPLEQFIRQQQQLQGNLAEQESAAPVMLAGSLAGPMASMGSNIGGLMPQLQQQHQTASVLSGVLPSFENAGGAQGPLAGAITQATSLIPGTPAAEYARQQKAAAATLAQLLHISPDEAAQILPQLTQAQGTARTPMNSVSSLLGNIGGAPQASTLSGL